jgi:predicted ATPase
VPWLRGEALLAGAGTASEAEAAIEQGIDVARQQNAKSWELRGVTSLARLRRQQGRPQEAVALLAPIYAWFTEGFDTADLKAARTLLDELESEVCNPHLTPALSAPKGQRGR